MRVSTMRFTDLGRVLTQRGAGAREVLYPGSGARNNRDAEPYERVQNVARGAALMTDCRVERVRQGLPNLLQNRTLNQVMYAPDVQNPGQLKVGMPQHKAAGDFRRPLDAAADVTSRSGPPAGQCPRRKAPGDLRRHRAPYDPADRGTLGPAQPTWRTWSWDRPTIAGLPVACYAFRALRCHFMADGVCGSPGWHTRRTRSAKILSRHGDRCAACSQTDRTSHWRQVAGAPRLASLMSAPSQQIRPLPMPAASAAGSMDVP